MGGFSVKCDCGKWFISMRAYRDHCKATSHTFHEKRVAAYDPPKEG